MMLETISFSEWVEVNERLEGAMYCRHLVWGAFKTRSRLKWETRGIYCWEG